MDYFDYDVQVDLRQALSQSTALWTCSLDFPGIDRIETWGIRLRSHHP